MRAVLRRAAGPDADTEGRLKLGPVVLDVPRHEVTVGDVPVELTPREFELLKVLLTNRGRLVTRERLLRAVWGPEYADAREYLHVYVGRLRRKLSEAGVGPTIDEMIATEVGIGYRVAEPKPASLTEAAGKPNV